METKRAFTLIELLMVIAIIAILAALSFPAISRAKGKARRTMCLGNLKQINSGLRMYCDDSNDKTPVTRKLTWINYKAVMKNYVGLNGPSSPKDKFFACPADTFHYEETSCTYVPAGRHEETNYDYSSYAFNGGNLHTNFHASQFGVALPGIGGRSLSSIRNPSKTVLVLEAAALQPYSWHQPKPFAAGELGPLNDSRNIISFVDGHVSYIKMYWNATLRYPDGIGSLACYYDPPAGYDYQWSGD